MFCIIVPTFVEIGRAVAEILRLFRVFQMKCKNSPDYRIQYGITLSTLKMIEENFVILQRYEHTRGV